MIAQKLRKAILLYLGYDPCEDVRQKTIDKEGNSVIEYWNIPEKELSIQEFDQIYNDNEIDILKEEKIKQIKSDYLKSLYSEYTILDLIELLSDSYEITNNKIFKGDITTDETTKLFKIKDQWEGIKVKKNLRDQFISEISDLTDYEDINNYTWSF